MKRTLDSFDTRKDPPVACTGLRGEALAKVTGAPKVQFCHAKRFIAIARSRAGALAPLEQALGS